MQQVKVKEMSNRHQLDIGRPFHKPIYALRHALTLCAELLRLNKASQKLGAERKSLAQSIKAFMKTTPGRN